MDENAAEELKALERENPEDPTYPRLLSVLLPDPADRADAAQRAVKLVTDVPEVYQALGEALMELDRADSAEIYFLRATDLEEHPGDAALYLARLKNQGGDRDGAEASYRQIAEKAVEPDIHDTAIRRLFILYWESGDTLQALGLARTSVGHVENPWILNDLAYTIADAKVDLPLAAELAGKAISGMDAGWMRRDYPEIDSNWAETTASRYRGYLYDTLAYVHMQGGETEEAIAALEKGRELIPYIDSEIMDHLAEAYQDAGRLDDAIEALLAILSISMNEDAMAHLVEIYTEKHGDTTGIAALVSDRRKNQTRPAPDFRMTTMDGEEVSLSDYLGQVVLLNFWFPT
jgi:tetratricopeptide (TPR) repeat protein